MNIRKINWPLWVGFLLTVIAAFSYYAFFVEYPVTRDFPWVNLLLFGIAVALLLIGLRRAFSKQQPHPGRSRIVGVILATLGIAICGLFIFGFFVFARFLPASQGAPQVGQKAPEFTLQDTNTKPVSLSELLSSPVNGKATKAVLLIFYRGSW
jgi:hypothetical protein